MLTATHWNTLRSLMNRIIPQDDFPDAWEASVGDYLMRQFERDLHAQVETYQHISLGLRHWRPSRGLLQAKASQSWMPPRRIRS
jgi:hypothetical protein